MYLYSQRPAAFLVRGGVALADIAFDGDREFVGGAAVFRQRGAIGLHQRRDLAEAAAVDDQPGVADPGGALHRHVGLAGDIDRRPARLHRLHADAGILHGVEPALVGDPSSVHSRFIRAMLSLKRGARSARGMPNASNSGSR